MTKKDKKQLQNALTGIIFIVGLYVWYKFTLDIISLLIILILPSIAIGLIFRIIPNKQKKSTRKFNKNVRNTSSKRIPNNRLLSDNQILKLDLKEISARELERLCYLYYRAKGYKPEETKNGADGGIDLIYYHPKHGKTAVQIKHYIHSQNQITVEKIRELDSAKKNYGCVFSEFITTSTFTNVALAEVPRSMETNDINWFKLFVIPWMKQESLKQKKTS
jgi:restriction system protein